MTDHQDAINQARAQFESISEMVEALRLAEQDEDDRTGCPADEARERINEDPLSVQVRSGWYTPGARDADTKPAEFEILLCTGGPAVRIVGELSEHGEPETAQIQWQDWFTPWTEWRPYQHGTAHTFDDAELKALDVYRETLLTYAGCFYFGKG